MTHDEDNDDRDDLQVVGRWYANSFEVGHNAFEFKVDCRQDITDGEVMTLYFRVIASPFNARELFRLLGIGLLSYADRFGAIADKGGASGTKSDA